MPIGTNPITSWQPPPPAPVVSRQFLANQAADGPLGAGESTGVGGTTSIATATSAANELGQDAFMKLLIAQLRNQDPLRPMEDREFIAQLAQFNSLEQMQGMNKSLQEMLTIQSLSDASSFIGRDVITRLIDDGGSFVQGVVTAVAMVDGSPALLVGPQRIPVSLSNVMGVRQRAERSAVPPSAPMLGSRSSQQEGSLPNSQNSPVVNSPFFSPNTANAASPRGVGSHGGMPLQTGNGLTSGQSLAAPPAYPLTGREGGSDGLKTP